MKFLYLLAALPVLAAAAPAPRPSGYYLKPRNVQEDAVFGKRQLTVAELKRRADYEGDHEHKRYYPSGYYAPRSPRSPRATDAA